MKKLSVKTYSGNATVFIGTEDESIGWLEVNYSPDCLDLDFESEEETFKENSEQISKDIGEWTLEKGEFDEIDWDSFNDVVETIKIHVSALISDYFQSKK